MVSGVAVIWAVGCGAVAGGAVATGGGGCFFLQPPRATKQTSKTAGMKMRAFRFNAVLLPKFAAQLPRTQPCLGTAAARRLSVRTVSPVSSMVSIALECANVKAGPGFTLKSSVDAPSHLSPCTPRSEKIGNTKNHKAKISSHFHRISAQVHRWYLRVRSLPTPVRHEIVAAVRQRMLLASIGEHRPDLRVPADLTLKHNVPHVR